MFASCNDAEAWLGCAGSPCVIIIAHVRYTMEPLDVGVSGSRSGLLAVQNSKTGEAMRAVRAVLTTLLLLPLIGCGTRVDLSDPNEQLNVGVRMARRDLWREAAFRFEKAVALNPADAMARNNLAVAYEGMGEFEKAREQYTEALKLDRGNEYVQRNYSRFVEFYQRNRAEAAVAAAAAAPDDEAADEEESSPAVTGDPGPTPQEIPPPVAQPDPPEPPVTTPPASDDPTEVTS